MRSVSFKKESRRLALPTKVGVELGYPVPGVRRTATWAPQVGEVSKLRQ
jgi:hypothetical protein